MLKKVLLILLPGTLFLSCKKQGDDSQTNSTPMTDLTRAGCTALPFDTADITALVPLGNLNPPAHTFPTDHMYIYCFTSKPALPIHAPGNIRIFRIGRTHYNAGQFNDHYDYNISLGSENSCLVWGHISELSQKLLDAVSNFSKATCEVPYTTGGGTFEQCYQAVSIPLQPGEIIGMAKSNNGLAGMDFGAVVNGTGVNPLEYFNPVIRTMLESKLGRFDGMVKRTLQPICGEINQDIAGTVQGNWIKKGFPKTPEDNNMALVKDNIDPEKQAISIGNSLPGLPSKVYYFVPQKTGFVNRDFSGVKADGNIYCYTLGLPNFPFPGNSTLVNTSVLLQLQGGTTLIAEKRNCDCTCGPYQFSANQVTYTK